MQETSQKILSQEALAQQVRQWQAQGDKVVFTNGCFDILHLGHIDYLEKARALGNRLVVAINTDASVKRLKGESRPVVEQYARCRMIAALAFVDAVCTFEEDTPKSLIEKISPDILTKGSDYSPENIIGADFVVAKGGEVKTIQLVDGFSTSKIIDKIKNFL
ncbi:MAG: D-glycero-beta-D-manno-heptose 1-phosphate adenylyltransferase [Raineya sp.]